MEKVVFSKKGLKLTNDEFIKEILKQEVIF